MKKYLIFIILLLFPIMVSALDYRLSSHIDIGSVFFENSNISLYVDDNYTYNFNFYLDGELIVDEFIEEETPYIDYRLFVYNNTKRIFLKNMDYETRIQDKIINFTIYFETVPSDVKIHCFVPDTIPINQVGVNDDRFDPQFCDDYLEEGNYYSSKDILYLYDYDATANFYIEDDSDSYYHDTLARYFPDLEDDTYWVYTVSDDIGYQGYLSPIFEAYVPPKFEFKCEPKTIKQGETSKCTLYGISDLDLIRVNFDVDPKRYEIVNVTYPKGITNQNGDKQYNLRIASSVEQDHEGQVLGVFEITNNENLEFEDPVQIINLDYVDEKARGEYPNLEDPVEILAAAEKAAEEKNPNTKAFSILVPLISFAITSVLYFIIAKTKKIKRYS